MERELIIDVLVDLQIAMNFTNAVGVL